MPWGLETPGVKASLSFLQTCKKGASARARQRTGPSEREPSESRERAVREPSESRYTEPLDIRDVPITLSTLSQFLAIDSSIVLLTITPFEPGATS